MRVPVVLLVAVAALAQDAELTVSLKQRPVREIAAHLSRLSNTKIEVAPEYADRKITVDTKATLAELVGAVAKLLRGEVHRDVDGTLHIVPAWQAKILKKLEKKVARVVWKDDETTVKDACQYLRSVAGLNVVLDRSVWSKAWITADVKDVSVRELLDLVAVKAKAQWRLRFGVIHLATADRLAELPEQVAWQDDKLLQKKFDVPFQETRLTVVVSYCKAATGVDIAFTPNAKEEAETEEVTLSAQQLTLAQVLALTLPPAGLTAEVENGAVKIRQVDQ